MKVTPPLQLRVLLVRLLLPHPLATDRGRISYPPLAARLRHPLFEPSLWLVLANAKVYSGVGADIVRKSFTYIIPLSPLRQFCGKRQEVMNVKAIYRSLSRLRVGTSHFSARGTGIRPNAIGLTVLSQLMGYGHPIMPAWMAHLYYYPKRERHTG